MEKIVKKINEDIKGFLNETTTNELVKILEILSYKYYEGKQLINDELFDYLRDELKKRDPTNKFLEEIGEPRMKEKIKLPYFMGSLNKIKADEDELNKWIEKYDNGSFIVSDKMDGVSALMHKKNGKIKLYSRGKNGYGRDISHFLPYIIKDIVIEDDMAIRGELIMTKEDAENLKIKNVRNVVAGLANAKHPNKILMTYVKYITYAIYHPAMKLKKQLETLKKKGFNVVPYIEIDKITIKFLNEYLDKRRKESLYDIDGIVIFDNSKIYEEQIETPKYGFAFKNIYNEQIAESIVLDVIWNVSMDGYLKPKIEIKPIELLGTTIQYATAFNAKFVVDNGIGIGAIVKIIKSGDVIPHILEVIKKTKPKMPNILYKWNETNVDIVLSDILEDNKNVAIKRIIHFFKTLEIKNINEGIITKLVNAGYDDIIKILKADKEDLMEIEGLGETIINKIYGNINKKMKNIKLYELMDASHIFGRGIGSKRLKPLIEQQPNILTKNYDKEELKTLAEQIEGFAEKNANKFANNFKYFKIFFKELNDIYDLNYLMKIKKKKIIENELKNKIYVMTGFRDKELEQKIEEQGGKISNSVSKNTYMVIYKNINEDSLKIRKAKKLNIKLISLDEFLKN